VQKDFDSTQGYSIEHRRGKGRSDGGTKGRRERPGGKRMTRDTGALAKDDRLDALAMAVAYWSKALTVETPEGRAEEA
jgi:hypothetical protein